MGAEIPYKVVVLRLVEDVVEVSAVTGSEAMDLAAKMPGVARAVSAHDVMTESALMAGLDDLLGRGER